MEIKAIIIDDEQRARNVLKNLIERSFSDIKIIEQCSTLKEGVQTIKKHNPNVVFLDVQMPNYNGYEIVDFFDEIDFEIIFVTAYDQYAIKAFELSAVDYLVKPVSRSRLAEAITRVSEKIKTKNQLEEYQILAKSIKEKEFSKIIIPELGNRRILELQNIIAIEADGAYSVIHLTNNEKITISKNLKYFENVIPKESAFFRSHRTWLISLNHTVSLNKSDLTLFLTNNIIAKLSRVKMEEFEQAL